MDELLELTKKQLKFQKFISACLAVMVVLMLCAGILLSGYVNRMTVAMEDAVTKIKDINIEEINDTITETQDMLESVEAFSGAVDEVTEKVKEFDGWISGLFGN